MERPPRYAAPPAAVAKQQNAGITTAAGGLITNAAAGYADVDFPFARLVRGEESTRYRSETNRRRTWSQWSFLVNPLLRLDATLRDYGQAAFERERYIVSTALRRSIADCFIDPANPPRFMKSKDVTWTKNNRTHTAYFNSVTHDQFDNQHVFDHRFWYERETSSKYLTPHMTVTYRVLHDSAFTFDEPEFKKVWTKTWAAAINSMSEELFSGIEGVRPRQSFLVQTDGRPRAPYVGNIRSHNLVGGAAYNNKDSRNPKLRSVWTSKPVGAVSGAAGAAFVRAAQQPAFPPIAIRR